MIDMSGLVTDKPVRICSVPGTPPRACPVNSTASRLEGTIDLADFDGLMIETREARLAATTTGST